jgi:gluconokinase
MGVSGAGKTNVAQKLSQATGWPMVEGDDHHPPRNREKMTRGEPLTDEDRGPWVDALAGAANAVLDGPVILACSALTQFVQAQLTAQSQRPCRWFLLRAR